MGKKYKHTQKAIIEAMDGTGGIKTEIADRLGVNRRTIDNYLKWFPKVKEAYDEEVQKVGDIAEGCLFGQIQSGNFQAIAFYLNAKCKERGYGQQEEQDSTKPVQLNLNFAPSSMPPRRARAIKRVRADG